MGNFLQARDRISHVVPWVGSLLRPVLESVSTFGGWEVSLTARVLESVCSSGGWWVSLTSPVLECVRSFVCWDVSVTRRGRSLSYTPLAGICLVSQLVGSFSYTPRLVWLFVGLEFLIHARLGICLVIR